MMETESENKRNIYVISFKKKKIFVDTYLKPHELNFYIENVITEAINKGRNCSVFGTSISLDEILNFEDNNIIDSLQECSDIESYRQILLNTNENYLFNFSISLLEDFLNSNTVVISPDLHSQIERIIGKALGSKINYLEYNDEDVVDLFKELIS